MFTGLIQVMGRLHEVDRSPDGAVLNIQTPLAAELRAGDSVAVDGVCLTTVEVGDGSFSVQASNETLDRTALARAARGAGVNLELPLRAGDRFGGHIVQGHVDGVGTVSRVWNDGIARLLAIEAPPDLLRYVVEKGSIAVDGVSLTVAGSDATSFTVWLIPETLERTTLGEATAGKAVNLEVDVLAKYVEKMVGNAR